MSLTAFVTAFAHPFERSGGTGTTNGSLSAPGGNLGEVAPVGLNQVFQQYGKLRPDGLSQSDVTNLAAQRGEVDAKVALTQAASREAIGVARSLLQLARIQVSHQGQMQGIHQSAADLAIKQTQNKSRYELGMGSRQQYVDGWTRVLDTSAQRVADW
jgi:hypothetical protein